MTNYRNSELIERYEDVVFELDTPLISNIVNNAHQKKSGHRFVVDNSGESAPLDWYHARFNVDINLETVAAGADVIAQAHNDDGTNSQGPVNSTHSLIKKLNIKMNSIDVYDCDDANHATNIKNLLEYSTGYSKCQGTKEFFYLDTTRTAESREFTAVANNQAVRRAGYNSGFTARKAQLNAGATVNAEIPLNRYGFFEALHTELLPNSRIELNITLEDDNNLVWKAIAGAAVCRVVLSKFQLIVPRIIFNADGKSLYMSNYLDRRKWSYLREVVYKSNQTTQSNGHYRMTGINKPRHVFMFIIDSADETVQTANKFLYKTFSVSTNPRTLTSCYLEVGNGKDYPEVHYRPHDEPTRVFRDLLKYVHANSDYAGDTLININNFRTIFPLVYFDLTKQPEDVRDGMTDLTFKYTLSGVTATNYSVYGLVLHKQDVELIKTSGRLVLRTM